jgi:hypothetical protein
MNTKDFGRLEATYGNVQVFVDSDDNIIIVKGNGCGSLSAALDNAELICGDEYTELDQDEMRWLDAMANSFGIE